MTAEETPDTINVDLPIEVTESGNIKVHGFWSYSRELWRDAVDNPNRWSPGLRAIAPAVVAWIERDEFEALPLPEVGRRIKATLRNGKEEGGTVTHVSESTGYTAVLVDGTRAIYINTAPETNEVHRSVLSWEYANEAAFEPLRIPEVGQQIKARLRDGREVEGKVSRAYRELGYVSIDLNSLWSTAYVVTSPDTAESPSDILAWEYVDEPAEPVSKVSVPNLTPEQLIAAADHIAAAIALLRGDDESGASDALEGSEE